MAYMSLNNKFPVRKQLRLRDYDYSGSGFYFVTIDCKYKECRFGHIQKGQMILNEFGEIAFNEWENIPSRFINASLHDFQILCDIIGAYKSIVANTCLELHKEKYKELDHIPLLGKIWHRSFYDHIIPDEPSFKSVSRYIQNNPKKWNRQ